ncbi:MAG: glycosyltransferase family 2 protein [Rhabdaerophilum sp.]
MLIPTYNRAARLDHAISSAFDQAPEGVMVHVFDNASTDGTEELVRRRISAGEPVRYTRHETNCGPIANFQHALSSVTTEFFVPLADDDWLVPGFLTQALAYLVKDPTLGAAIFKTEARTEDGSVLETYPQVMSERRKGRLEPSEHLEDWLRFGHYHWSSVLWRRTVLDHIGAPYLHVGLPSDVDFQVLAFSACPVVLVDALGAGYLIHGGQHGGDLSMDHLRGWATIFRNLDREILGRRLMTTERYLELRRTARDRYGILWHRGNPPESAKDLRVLALDAGFGLDDWDLAYRLAGLAEQASPTAPLFQPPHWIKSADTDVAALDRIIVEAMGSKA